MELLVFNDKGIYCQQADVYIDPWKPVKKVLITHGHSDHAYGGHQHYLCHRLTGMIIRSRISKELNIQSLEYGEQVTINGVTFSFHPAGHIIGSSQIRVEYKGEVWVTSGDYKLEDDGISTPFEPVKCDTFITECTFGLPVYKWKPQEEVFDGINTWWKQNSALGKPSMLLAYSLGKAQRILANIDASIGKIYTHGAVENLNEVFRNAGLSLPDTERITKDTDPKLYPGSLILAPPSALGSTWSRKFKNLSTAAASGWMTLRGARRRKGVDRGFVLSDHSDWDELNKAIKYTGAENIITTHGYTSVFTEWLKSQGYNARVESTTYEGETMDSTKEEQAA